MLQVAVASANPAKIKAVQDAFLLAFPDHVFAFAGYPVASGVADQPMSNAETLQGAENRLTALQQQSKADYFVAIEAGFEDGFTFAWMLVRHLDQTGRARSASVPLPPAVITQLQQGAELSDVMDQLFGTHNIKHAGGAIGLLTGHRLTRSSVYQQALLLALIPFLSPKWF